MNVRVKPNLPVLGPKLGADLRGIQEALAQGDYEHLQDGRIAVAGRELETGEFLVERASPEGWAIAEQDGLAVALDTAIDEELELEGRVLDLIHRLNSMRREQGLELTDRIVVELPADHAELVERHGDWIKAEVLAVSIETNGSADEPTIARAQTE